MGYEPLAPTVGRNIFGRQVCQLPGLFCYGECLLIYLELDDIGKCDRQESLKKMYRKHVFLKFLCDHFFELECKSLICVLSSAHCEH